jgi:hypothetical protein
VSTPEPIAKERTQPTPSRSVPQTSSVEPPPTSTTPTWSPGPWCAPASVPVAPENASRASSSPVMTSTATPARACTASQSSCWFGAPRTAAVATTRSARAPASRASATWAATTSATAAIRTGSMLPSGARPAPRRVKARSAVTSRSTALPVPGSATSRRVVFDPMSMQAHRIGRSLP